VGRHLARSALVPALAILLLPAAGGCSPTDTATSPGSTTSAPTGFPTGTLTVRTKDGEASLRVEVAETAEARATGFMGRRSLAEDEGMVFLFDGPTEGPFWMKDTLIPLSIAFWDEDGRILAILDMDPCRADPCPLFSPGVTYVGAVEVNQGWFQRHQVSAGDTVELAG
jgi:uncharacterized membrane protein (UPF0127 family)